MVHIRSWGSHALLNTSKPAALDFYLHEQSQVEDGIPNPPVLPIAGFLLVPAGLHTALCEQNHDPSERQR